MGKPESIVPVVGVFQSFVLPRLGGVHSYSFTVSSSRLVDLKKRDLPGHQPMQVDHLRGYTPLAGGEELAAPLTRQSHRSRGVCSTPAGWRRI
jgi:hypothetical protein